MPLNDLSIMNTQQSFYSGLSPANLQRQKLALRPVKRKPIREELLIAGPEKSGRNLLLSYDSSATNTQQLCCPGLSPANLQRQKMALRPVKRKPIREELSSTGPEKRGHLNNKCQPNLSEEEIEELLALATKDFELGLKKTKLFRKENNQIIHRQEEQAQFQKENDNNIPEFMKIQLKQVDSSRNSGNCAAIIKDTPENKSINEYNAVILSRNCELPASDNDTELRVDRTSPKDVQTQEANTYNNLEDQELSESCEDCQQKPIKSESKNTDGLLDWTTFVAGIKRNLKYDQQPAPLQSELPSSSLNLSVDIVNSEVICADIMEEYQACKDKGDHQLPADSSGPILSNIDKAEMITKATGCVHSRLICSNIEPMESLYFPLTAVLKRILRLYSNNLF